MKISVVVPTFNRKQRVLQTLETLFRQSCAPEDYEIIVVVDGSTDGTAEVVRALQPACGFTIVEQRNQGLAAARNSGFRASHADVVLFLDDDMLCDTRLVEEHLKAHAEGPVVVLGTILVSTESARTLATECIAREWSPESMVLRPDATWQEIPFVFGNTSIARDLLEATGGFDERFLMREDLELGYRLLQRGAKYRAVPAAISHHAYDKTASRLLRDAEAFAVSDVLFAQMHPENRVKGQLNWLTAQPAGKLKALELAMALGWLADPALSVVCLACETGTGIPMLREAGIRALQMRRRLRWFTRVLQQTQNAHRVRALVLLRLAHTAIWAFFVAAILAIPVAGALGRFQLASWLTVIVLGECMALAFNHWHCPISNLANKLTDDRTPNYDIYLPAWLARKNTQIFGTLFVLSLLMLAEEWWRHSR
ncbi:MAG TPA: glycosyltransferase family 2 protein [Terracidiphilus sp.]|nr:glycosyltransferase family 2 protein [Terracidiphilus sp.]